ncbi:MAG: KxYKxGKxW signal peptide domain-containing protein [Streptococcaceae bacterium]|nr:KxYKxGKxW signal peptide domain-containing protein [Streptococcaceae bacterium]
MKREIIMENLHTHFRSWKSGKLWLYAATALAALTFASATTAQTHADTIATPVATVTTTSAASVSADSAQARSVAALSAAPNAVTADNTPSSAVVVASNAAVITSVVTSSVAPQSSQATPTTSEVASLMSSATAANSLGADVTSSAGLDVPAVTSVIPTAGTPDTTALTSNTIRQIGVVAAVAGFAGSNFAASQGRAPVQIGDVFYEGDYLGNPGTGKEYQVMMLVDSTSGNSSYAPNGLQAIAAAPVVNGVADTSQIIIAYAGTSETIDWLTDFETVAGGSSVYADPSTGATMPSQVVTGKAFADAVLAAYPTSSYLFTGISLGGYLGMAMAAMLHQPALTFVGPDPSNVLSATDIAYVHAHPTLYFNIRSLWDTVLGDHGGNALNDSIFYDYGDMLDPLKAHTDLIHFNADGSISAPVAPVAGPIINAIASSVDLVLDPLAAVFTAVVPTVVPAVNATVTAVTQVTTAVAAAVSNAVNSVVSSVTSAVASTLGWFHW